MKVHTSLSLLTHFDRKIQIDWNEDIKKGVKRYDNFVRNYNQGMRHTNVRMGIGLVDGEHIVDVENNHIGFGLFATSQVETIIIFSNGIVVNGLDCDALKEIILHGVAGILNDTKKIEKFKRIIDDDAYSLIFEETKKAIETDTLTLFPFVNLVEKLTMIHEGWL